MNAALVQICSDPRLNHEVIRVQIQDRLDRMGLTAERIFVLNEIGGNIGSNMLNTLELLAHERQRITLAGVLHHDDCLAHRAGRREPLNASLQTLSQLLASRSIRCPVLSGHIETTYSTVTWSDEPRSSYETLAFRMPRLGD